MIMMRYFFSRDVVKVIIAKEGIEDLQDSDGTLFVKLMDKRPGRVFSMLYYLCSSIYGSLHSQLSCTVDCI